jgi:hypothetical protein
MNGALSLADAQDTVVFLESDLSNEEWTERKADELAIEMAGKDRLEKALIIGEKLSHIYNSGSFRRSAPGGERWTWEDWVNKRLPELLPGEAPKLTQANCRRFLWETRQLLSPHRSTGVGGMPVTAAQAEVLQGLIPRKLSNVGNWAPAILDDPDQAEGLAKVWEMARQNAAKQQRKSGPTVEDVRAAREELRPKLAELGLIREAPKAFQQSTAERVEFARQRTIDVDPVHEERKAAAFRETMANIRDTKAERTAKVEVDQVREQLDAAEKERRHTLEQEVRIYNGRLHAASTAIHELLGYLQSLSRIHGTELLDEMRCIDVLGLITVKDDMQRLQDAGQELIQAVNLARSSDPPSGINAETIEV